MMVKATLQNLAMARIEATMMSPSAPYANRNTWLQSDSLGSHPSGEFDER